MPAFGAASVYRLGVGESKSGIRAYRKKTYSKNFRILTNAFQHFKWADGTVQHTIWKAGSVL